MHGCKCLRAAIESAQALRAGGTGVMFKRVVIGVALALSVPSGLTASTGLASVSTAEPIYTAAAIVANTRPVVRRCNGFTVTTGRYTGNAVSGDPRMAGRMSFAGRFSVNSAGSSGVATGQFVIRDRQQRIRMRANLTGVVTSETTVNGIVSGSLFRPNARITANVTIAFDDVFRFGAVRIGLETGLNSAVAYPTNPNCR